MPPDGSPPPRWPARSRRAGPTPPLWTGRGTPRCGSWPRRPPGTCPTARSSSPGCAEILGVEPEVISGEAGGRLSFTGATIGLPGRCGVAVPGGRHRRRVDGVRARIAGSHPPYERGHRMRADDRAAPRRRPADAVPRWRPRRPTSTRRSRVRPSTSPWAAAATLVGLAGLGHHRRGHRPGPAHLRLDAHPPQPDPGAGRAPDQRRAARDDPGAARRTAGDASRAASTSSARVRWSCAGSWRPPVPARSSSASTTSSTA